MCENIKCETCNTSLIRNKSQIKASKTGLFFCNRECKSKWHSSKFKEQQVFGNCKYCGQVMRDAKSRLKDYCSRDCLGKVKSKLGTDILKCDSCNEYFTKLKSQVKTNNFCSVECRNNWSANLNKRILLTCKVCQSQFTVVNGRKITAKTCSKKCSNIFKSQEATTNPKIIEQLKSNGVKTARFGKKQNTVPEILTKQYLDNNGIDFEFQKSVNNRYIVDFYLPSMNLILEVYGDYWHCNPKVYNSNKNKPSDSQIKQSIKDKEREFYLKKCGYNFECIWEKEIHTDLNFYMKKIINQYP